MTFNLYYSQKEIETKTVMADNTITWKEYLNKFEEILNQENPEVPYNDPAFFDYLKLNNSRQNRWLKKGEINKELTEVIKRIDEKQTWYLIVEPWCGDAAHSAPFIYLMSEINTNITLKVVLRDTPPLMIENYLTNGGKSIPKLIIRNSAEKDLLVWGPRPLSSQNLFQKLKDENADFEKTKIELQKWYNKDKGVSIQNEFTQLLDKI